MWAGELTLKIRNIDEEVWKNVCPLYHLIIDKDVEFIERIRRYVCPMAFVEYVRQLVVKEYKQLASKYYDAREIVDVVHTIEYRGEGVRTQYLTVPVIAYYDHMANEVFKVEISNGMKIIEVTAKCLGVEWVPLIHEDTLYVFAPRSLIVVRPPPKKLTVITLEPKGASKVGET